MALLRVFQEIDNDIWKLTFVNAPEYLSEGDKKLMSQFGEPEIDLGGTFLEDTANEFTLPTKKAKLRSDFPYTSSFDSRDSDFSENTKIKVEGYRDAIVARFTDAMTDLREIEDTFTGERTYNI
jgi:hypothetical protein